MRKTNLLIFLLLANSLFIPLALSNPNKLIIYTYGSFISEWGPGPKIKEEFEKECNCELVFIGIDSSIGILGRLKLEGEETSADIILGLDTNLLTTASNTNLLVKHNVNISNLELPINWSNDFFIPYDWGHFAFIYNSNLLDKTPKSFNELVNESTLKIIIQDPRTSTPGLKLLL